MAKPYTIDALISEHREHLGFAWLISPQTDHLPLATASGRWLGEYHPEAPHAIEIVHPQNYRQLSHCLAHGNFYLAAGQERVRPDLLIFSEDMSCEAKVLAALQANGLPAVRTALPAITILRELAYALAQQGEHLSMHGVLLAIHDRGVLLTGASGIGKSAVALELITRGHRLIADDAPLLYRHANTTQVRGICPPLLADFLEVRALGVLNVSKLFGPMVCAAMAPLNLVIELVDSVTLDASQRLQPCTRLTNILGVAIPHLQLPSNHATNLAVLVETATKNQVLYEEGYDAAASLAHRQQQLMNKQPV